MKDRHEEEDLRERFRSLREDRIARTPDFQAMMARARADAATVPDLGVVDGGAQPVSGKHRGRRLVRLGGWVSAAVAAAAAVVVLVRPSADDREFVQLVSAYSAEASLLSPTSRLLAVPGIELVNSVPSVGGSLGVTGATTPDDDGGRS